MDRNLDEKLESLRDGLADAAEGYERAVASVDDATLRGAFEQALTDKRRSISEVEACMTERPDDEAGTLIGSVTRAVVQLRAAVTGDESLLPGMIDGEQRVTERCDEALAAATHDPAARDAVQRVRTRQSEILSTLRGLETARS